MQIVKINYAIFTFMKGIVLLVQLLGTFCLVM